MPRVTINDLDKYNTGGGKGRFFKLANDHDTATVRFMLEDAEDINDYIFVVHKVKTVDGKFRQVNCLREYGDEIDACPLCADKQPITTRMFVPVYNIDSDAVQFWDRSKSFIQKMTSLCGRYKNLVGKVFDVERNGEAGDKQTTYEIYPHDDRDDITLEDLPEVPDPLGSVVVDASEEDMEYFLEEGKFPPNDDEEDEEPVRKRRSSSKRDEDDEDEDDEEEEKPRRHERERKSSHTERRTAPARSSRRSKEDKF